MTQNIGRQQATGSGVRLPVLEENGPCGDCETPHSTAWLDRWECTIIFTLCMGMMTKLMKNESIRDCRLQRKQNNMKFNIMLCTLITGTNEAGNSPGNDEYILPHYLIIPPVAEKNLHSFFFFG